MDQIKSCIEDCLIEIHQQNIHFDSYQESAFDIKKILEPHRELLSPVEFIDLQNLFLSIGPLENLIHNKNIKEININSFDKIYIEDHSSYRSFPKNFVHPILYTKFLDFLQKEIKSECNLERPFVNGKWLDFRVHICHSRVSGDYAVSLRRKLESKVDFSTQISKQMFTSSQTQLLQDLMLKRKNIIVVGPTGCGKTSLVSLLLKSHCKSERVILIEDCDEIIIPNHQSCKLLSAEACPPKIPEITLFQLIKQSMRMRPDRIVFGEVRGEEAKDLLLAFSTGHDGCLTTLHASSAREALQRLEMLVHLGAPDWPSESIRKLIYFSLNNIVVMQRQAQQIKCQGIYEISSIENFGFTISSLL